jgi:hypothetical protein
MPEIKNNAQPFRAQAERIERNPPSDFGGAFVITPPSGEAIHGLLVGTVDEATFWSIIKTKIEIALLEAADRERQQKPFQR